MAKLHYFDVIINGYKKYFMMQSKCHSPYGKCTTKEMLRKSWQDHSSL